MLFVLYRVSLLLLQDLYRGSGRFFLKEVFFSCDEDVLAQPLTRVQTSFPSVQLGSYPDMSPENSYQVRVALESKDLEMVEKVSTTYLAPYCLSVALLQAFSKLVFLLPVGEFPPTSLTVSVITAPCHSCNDVLQE